MVQIKENSIVRFASLEVMENLFEAGKLSKKPVSVNDYYGIVRDSFKDVYYVEFFNRSTKSLDVMAVASDDIVEIGGLYNLIKTSVMSRESKNTVNRIKPKKKEIEKESNDKKEEMNNSTENTTESSPESLEGLRIISTGKYQFFTSKEDFISKIEAAGGVYQGSVNNKLNYLVVCSGANQKRIEACRVLGITEISEYDFYNRIK